MSTWSLPVPSFWFLFHQSQDLFARHFKFKSVTWFLLCTRVFSPTADILKSEKTLGTRLFRAFPKRVGPRILSLESVDYLGTSEHYWLVEKKRILISKTAGVVNFHCMQMHLVMSMRFIFGDDWDDVPCKSLFFYPWQWCNFSGIEALEFSCICIRA